jgi:rhodanese-related sulfurtransferase
VRLALPWWFPLGRVPEIEPHDLQQRLRGASPPQLLDVRTRAEWTQGHIASATNVPITELPSRVESLPLDRDRLVVAVCLSGHRSAPAVRLLARRGCLVQHLRGGMLAWKRAGLPVAVG